MISSVVITSCFFIEKFRMPKKFNENLVKAMQTTQEAVKICKQAMVDANDDSCRAMYQAILKDCEKHVQMLQGEMELHKVQKKWDS